MAFTEFVIPTLKNDPGTEASFMSELAPFLVQILDNHVTPPKLKYFGKILLENGNDVSADFRLALGLGSLLPVPSLSSSLSLHHHPPVYATVSCFLLSSRNHHNISYANASIEWVDQAHFDSFVASENFQIFKDRVLPYSTALPVPQLYDTDVQPVDVFGSAMTEAWQVKIGEGNEMAEKSKVAWEKFVRAVAEAGGVSGDDKSFHGTSLNLEERRWVGALGWESSEVSTQFPWF